MRHQIMVLESQLDKERVWFVAAFDAVFAGNGTAVIPTPPQSPRSNAFPERWIRTARAECTDRLLITGERHLRPALTTYAEHYNTGRAHRSLDLRARDDQSNVIPLPAATVRRRQTLGGLLVPTRDHTVAEQSKNNRYSTNHQVVIDADSRLVVVVGRPVPGNRNDCKAWVESGTEPVVGNTTTTADGGYPGTGLVMPHRRRKGEELPDWKQAHNKSHKQVRARVEHAFARVKTWKILRDCRLKGDGVQDAMSGIARLHNLALTGWTSEQDND